MVKIINFKYELNNGRRDECNLLLDSFLIYILNNPTKTVNYNAKELIEQHCGLEGKIKKIISIAEAN